MKHLISFGFIILFSFLSVAQAPNAFKYQAIARDNNGDPLVNQTVNFRIRILEGSTDGSAVYAETQLVSTNAYGLVSMTIGEGEVLNGSLATLDWGTGSYFIQVAVDVDGGSNFQVLGSTQLLSVPYALYAESSGSSEQGPKGDQGDTGPQGEKGDTGDTGATGESGEKGDTGDQGPAGDDGTDGQDGSQGVKGDKGDSGDQGIQGVPGPPGANGSDGDQGLQGIQGIKGDKGDKGDAGDQGIQGIQGLPGADGSDGAQGTQGIKGDKGDKGDAGDQGIQGIQGLPGADGSDGAQGIQGVKGDKGDKGDAGDQGIQGIQGFPGADGSDGAQGTQGIQGIQGDKGDTGNTGPRGLQGIQGVQGQPGQDANGGSQYFYLTAQDFQVYDNSIEINYAVQYDNTGGLQSGRAYLTGGKDQNGLLIAQINLPNGAAVKQADVVTDDDRGLGVVVSFMELPFDAAGGGAQVLGSKGAPVGTKRQFTIGVNASMDTERNIYYILYQGFTHDSLPINNSIYRVRVTYEN